MKCGICDSDPIAFQWTDTHGVAQCITCGAAHTVLHYEDGARVERPPELLVIARWVPMFRAYWAEFKRPMPGGFSFGNNARYEVASRADTIAFAEWTRAHRDEYAPAAEVVERQVKRRPRLTFRQPQDGRGPSA